MLTTAPVPRLPELVPAPICKVPLLMLVVPLYVLLIARMAVLEPFLVRSPAPLSVPLPLIV